jgi:hypothetical protein
MASARSHVTNPTHWVTNNCHCETSCPVAVFLVFFSAPATRRRTHDERTTTKKQGHHNSSLLLSAEAPPCLLLDNPHFLDTSIALEHLSLSASLHSSGNNSSKVRSQRVSLLPLSVQLIRSTAKISRARSARTWHLLGRHTTQHTRPVD